MARTYKLNFSKTDFLVCVDWEVGDKVYAKYDIDPDDPNADGILQGTVLTLTSIEENGDDGTVLDVEFAEVSGIYRDCNFALHESTEVREI